MKRLLFLWALLLNLLSPASHAENPLEISSQVFTDFTHFKNYVGPQEFRDPVSQTGVNIERAYLTVDYAFDENWRMRWRADANIAFNQTSRTTEQELFVKNALVAGDLSSNLTVEIGIVDTPWIAYEETLWQHRYVSRVITDTDDSSSDAGIALKGRLAEYRVEYHLAAVNGGGYKDISTANTSLDFDSRLGFVPRDDWTVDLQVRDGHNGTQTETERGTRARLYQLMVTYGAVDHRIGINYFERESEMKSTSVTREFEGYAIWGWTDLKPGTSLFARIEHSKVLRPSNAPSSLPDSTDTDRIVVGIDRELAPGLRLGFAVDYAETDDPSLLPGFYAKEEQYGLYLEATI